MSYTTLISAEQLQALMATPQFSNQLRIFDCTFELAHPHVGQEQYLKSHLPGAIYADLDKSLSAVHGVPGPHGVLTASGADAPASGGRHPLPNRERLATWLSSVGMGNDMQAVVYDRNGSSYCGRLWWMLKWAGHENVAILDGGLQAWQKSGGQINEGEESAHFQASFILRPKLAVLVDTQTVAAQLGRPAQTLIDARSTQRFKGELEPLDPVAGHIPGALNRPFSQNLTAEGKFKSAELLKSEFTDLLGLRSPETVVHHCGSGVGAVPNLVAMEIAGLGRAGLYAGSWSEWCSDPNRPVAQG